MATTSARARTKAKTTDRIIFNIPTKLKIAVKKRAFKEGTDITTVLNQTMSLYADGSFDPEDYLSKEEMRSLFRAEAEVKAGRYYSLNEVEKHLASRRKKL